MTYSFKKFIIEVMKKENRPLGEKEIWKIGESMGLNEHLGSKGKTPWTTVGISIYENIKLDNPIFKQISKRPALFQLLDFEDSGQMKNEEQKEATKTYCEKDLHILLSTFVLSDTHFKCHTKTIKHEKSKSRKGGYSEWLHPNMVGFYFPYDDYEERTLQLQSKLKDNPYKIFSFELKKEITFANLREVYFQAVSNSSWANEGYLVTLDIQEDPMLIDEIRRLNSAFGIGLIKLNGEYIYESEILFPSKYNVNLDWDTINRLAEENTDFDSLLEEIIGDIKSEMTRGKYDKILDEEEYMQYVRKKGIIPAER